MTDTPDTTPSPAAAKPKRWRGRPALLLAGIALAGGLAGAFATKAISKVRGDHHGGHGFEHMGGPMGLGMGGRGPLDPAKAERHAERMAEGFSRRIDATGDQQAKLVAIAKAAAKDMIPLRQQAQSARKDAMKIMAAAQVDRAALEKLRSDQVAGMDAMSKRMVTALADAADVLTPEQRQKVAARFEARHEGRRGWFRGEGRGPDGGRGPADAPDGIGGEPKKQ